MARNGFAYAGVSLRIYSLSPSHFPMNDRSM